MKQLLLPSQSHVLHKYNVYIFLIIYVILYCKHYTHMYMYTHTHTHTHTHIYIYSSVNMTDLNKRFVYSPQGKIECLESEKPFVIMISMKDLPTLSLKTDEWNMVYEYWQRFALKRDIPSSTRSVVMLSSEFDVTSWPVFNNGNIRAIHEICSKLTIKTLKWG